MLKWFMTPRDVKKLDRELNGYLSSMVAGMGRTERRESLVLYMTGLLLDGERKSIEPIAARLVDSPEKIGAMRQRLQQCVVSAAWAEDEVWARLARKLEEDLPDLETFVFDDTGFPKKGAHSVGVARQYSGTLGRTDNCQVAVSLHLAGEKGSGMIGMQLYLPKEWTDDPDRLKKAGVPAVIKFKKKWELALELLDRRLADGVEPRLALGDAGYGDCGEFRQGLVDRHVPYLLGVTSTALVWPEGKEPLPPPVEKVTGKVGRPRTKYKTADEKPMTIAALATSLPQSAYQKVTWREGSKGKMTSHFARFRVRTARGHDTGKSPGQEQWLLVEWPADEEAPTKFLLSDLPASITLTKMVRLAHLRWRVERDYQDLKGELGLDHYEGRTWRGFHHHVALAAVAHGFLAIQRALFPPTEDPLDASDGSTAAPGRASPVAGELPSVPAVNPTGSSSRGS